MSDVAGRNAKSPPILYLTYGKLPPLFRQHVVWLWLPAVHTSQTGCQPLNKTHGDITKCGMSAFVFMTDQIWYSPLSSIYKRFIFQRRPHVLSFPLWLIMLATSLTLKNSSSGHGGFILSGKGNNPLLIPQCEMCDKCDAYSISERLVRKIAPSSVRYCSAELSVSFGVAGVQSFHLVLRHF